MGLPLISVVVINRQQIGQTLFVKISFYTSNLPLQNEFNYVPLRLKNNLNKLKYSLPLGKTQNLSLIVKFKCSGYFNPVVNVSKRLG